MLRRSFVGSLLGALAAALPFAELLRQRQLTPDESKPLPCKFAAFPDCICHDGAHEGGNCYTTPDGARMMNMTLTIGKDWKGRLEEVTWS